MNQSQDDFLLDSEQVYEEASRAALLCQELYDVDYAHKLCVVRNALTVKELDQHFGVAHAPNRDLTARLEAEVRQIAAQNVGPTSPPQHPQNTGSALPRFDRIAREELIVFEAADGQADRETVQDLAENGAAITSWIFPLSGTQVI